MIKSYLIKQLEIFTKDQETIEALEEQFMEWCEDSEHLVDLFIADNLEYLKELRSSQEIKRIEKTVEDKKEEFNRIVKLVEELFNGR